MSFLKICCLCCGILLLFTLIPEYSTAASIDDIFNSYSGVQEKDLIKEIVVELNISNATVPQPLKDKVYNSILSVGKKSLVGKTFQQATELKPSLEQIMKKVFNEVLTGFKVESVEILVGNPTKIVLNIISETPTVEKVRIELKLQGIHPMWNELLKDNIAKLLPTISSLMVGLPIKSSSWSDELLENIIAGISELHALFPGFTVIPEIEIGVESRVVLKLQPESPTIRMVFAKIRSATIPSLILERLKNSVLSHSDLLIGLPLVFVEKNKKFLLDEALKQISQTGFSKTFKIRASVRIDVLRDTLISILVESDKYSSFIKAKASLGKELRNPDFEAHLGLLFNKKLETFGEINLYPGPISIDGNLGMGLKVSPFLYVAGGKNVVDGIRRFWLNYYPSEDFILFWEEGVTEDNIEAGITYRAHDFFSIEALTDFKKDIWFRFVANL